VAMKHHVGTRAVRKSPAGIVALSNASTSCRVNNGAFAIIAKRTAPTKMPIPIFQFRIRASLKFVDIGRISERLRLRIARLYALSNGEFNPAAILQVVTDFRYPPVQTDHCGSNEGPVGGKTGSRQPHR